jgi:hypothetical protein
VLDLDFIEAFINRPHIIDLRDDGWTIMHPPACHPNLFDCQVNRAASEQVDGPLDFQGRYYCGLDDLGQFYVGDGADHAQGVDWNALVAELRAARECVHALRSAPMPLTEESRQVGATFLRLFDAWFSELALPALNALDKVTGSGS